MISSFRHSNILYSLLSTYFFRFQFNPMDEISVSLLLLFLTIAFYFTRRYFTVYSYWKKRGVPTPGLIMPFFGNTFSITCGDQPLFHFQLKNYFKFSSHRFSGYYDFERPILVIRDPDLTNQILTKDFAYFQDRGLPYDEEKEPLTANLFTMGGQRWKNLRTKITSCFTTIKRKLMYATIIDLMEKLKETVEISVDENEDIEIKDILAR